MKRGLKVHARRAVRAPQVQRCRVFPDEEGTESYWRGGEAQDRDPVAEYSPMKRGLKDFTSRPDWRAKIVAEYSPMKRGLKDKVPRADASGRIGCRVFPDEEGTERALAMLRRRRAESCRVFPDEEGTESGCRCRAPWNR